MFRKIRTAQLVSVATLGLIATPSFAQTQETAEPETGGLEQIVVTAQRRAENQQDVPIAVTTITASVAEKIGITEPQTIAQIVPGLTLNRSSASAVPFIRGVGTPSSTIGNEPSVATFVDDVYLTNGAATFFEFNNIAQIEVLKGPQGTLFGRNATGGVIHVHTKNPEQEFSGSATATYGNYDTYSSQLYLTGGITENVAANVAAYYKKQEDGWGRNIVTGNDAFTNEGRGVRAKLLFDNGATRVLLNGNYDRSKGSQGIAARVIPGTVSRGGYNPDALGAGFYDSTSTVDNRYDITLKQISAKIEQDVGVARLVSITAYTDLLAAAIYDIDTAPVNFFQAQIDQGGKTFTQEVQVVSPEGSDISWLLGAFFLKDTSTFDAVYSGIAFGGLGGAAPLFTRQRTTSYSGFGQATMEIMPRTKLTLGLRYTSDQRKFDGFSQGTIGGTQLTFTSPNNARTFSNITGRAAIDHQFTPDFMGYVAYNKGFKSGIFNLGGVNPGSTALQQPANPEDLNAITAGFKSEWLDRRLRVNVEGFYYDYKDIQVATLLVGSQIITNAGAATMKGVDVEVTAVPIEGLTLTGSMTYEDGKYTNFPGGPQNFPLNGNTPVPFAIPPCDPGQTDPNTTPSTAPLAVRSCDLSGNRTVNTPKLSSNLGFVYSAVAGTLPFDVAASWSHKSSYFFETDNNPGVLQSPTDIINASLTLYSPDKAFRARLWANNLTKQKYYTYITQSGTSGTKYSPAPPRTYGITLGVDF